MLQRLTVEQWAEFDRGSRRCLGRSSASTVSSSAASPGGAAGRGPRWQRWTPRRGTRSRPSPTSRLTREEFEARLTGIRAGGGVQQLVRGACFLPRRRRRRRWRACRPASTSARRAPSPASRCRALAGRAGCSARRPSSRAPTSSPPGSSLLLRLRLRASRLPNPSTPGHGGCQALDPAAVDPDPVPRAHSQAVWCGSLFVAAATRASGRGGGSPPPPPPPPSPLTPSIGLQGRRKLGKVRILPPPHQLNPSAIVRPSEWIT